MGEKEVEGKLVGEEAKGFWAKKVVHSERWDYCRSSSLRLPDAVIHHLVRGDRQHVLLLRQEQFVVLVEVEDERGEEGGSLSDVGEGPCHYFMNYYTPIYRLDPDIAPNRVLAMVKLIRLGILLNFLLGTRKPGSTHPKSNYSELSSLCGPTDSLSRI